MGCPSVCWSKRRLPILGPGTIALFARSLYHRLAQPRFHLPQQLADVKWAATELRNQTRMRRNAQASLTLKCRTQPLSTPQLGWLTMNASEGNGMRLAHAGIRGRLEVCQRRKPQTA